MILAYPYIPGMWWDPVLPTPIPGTALPHLLFYLINNIITWMTSWVRALFSYNDGFEQYKIMLGCKYSNQYSEALIYKGLMRDKNWVQLLSVLEFHI